MKCLVTGSAGSVGRVLVEELRDLEHPVFPFDKADDPQFDVTQPASIRSAVTFFKPDVIFHLAAWKQAPEGELEPYQCAVVNIDGTQHVLTAAAMTGAKVITTSTCKACDPETAYGATKLIAERMTLNAGGTVVRFYNIPESDGNVFRLWESIPEDEPIPYTNCYRYFVSMEDSVALLLKAMDLPPGRYVPDEESPWHMQNMAKSLYPDRELTLIPRRRGDRVAEPIQADGETSSRVAEGVYQITSPYDPSEVPAWASAAA